MFISFSEKLFNYFKLLLRSKMCHFSLNLCPCFLAFRREETMHHFSIRKFDELIQSSPDSVARYHDRLGRSIRIRDYQLFQEVRVDLRPLKFVSNKLQNSYGLVCPCKLSLCVVRNDKRKHSYVIDQIQKPLAGDVHAIPSLFEPTKGHHDE